MSDLHLLEATRFPAMTLSEGDLKSACAKWCFSQFVWNVQSVGRMLEAPLFAFITAGSWQDAQNFIQYKYCKPTDSLDEMAGVIGAHIEEIESRMRTFLAAMAPPDNASLWMHSANQLNTFINKFPSVKPVYVSILGSQLVQGWCAFECLAGDLWERALNENPAFAALKGSAKRIRRKQGEGRQQPVEASGKQQPDQTISLREMARITKNTFDIRGMIGTILAKEFRFDSLSGIREAYSRAFDQCAKIDDALSNDCLDSLAAVRNVQVHGAGVPDEEYMRKVDFLPKLPKKTENERLFFDGTTVSELFGPVILRGCDLLRAVDEAIS